jgi:hypothetical protein
MSAKTLKYSHAPNCTAKKQAEVANTTDDRYDVTEAMIEQEVQKRLGNKRVERATRREEMVSKLIQDAF